MKDCQRLQSLALFGLFLVLTEYSWICFHLESWIEGDGSHQRKVIFRIFLFCVGFLKVEYLLEAYFPRVCVDGYGPAEVSIPGTGLACEKYMKP